MKQFLMTICGFLFITSVAMADDTTTEMCANGAGTVISGAVTGHKYCMSNNPMNWWNAYAWCDAQGRRLISMDECACSALVNCDGKCPEFRKVYNKYIWTTTSDDTAESVYTSYSDSVMTAMWTRVRSGSAYSVCY